MSRRKVYQIIGHSRTEVYVSLLRYSYSSEYRSELEQDIRNLGITRATVFLDLAVQNGTRNRIARRVFRDSQLVADCSEPSDNISRITAIFNRFMQCHRQIILQSFLSDRQKAELLSDIDIK